MKANLGFESDGVEQLSERERERGREKEGERERERDGVCGVVAVVD